MIISRYITYSVHSYNKAKQLSDVVEVVGGIFLAEQLLVV